MRLKQPHVRNSAPRAIIGGLFVFLIPLATAYAQSYQPLTAIPGVSTNSGNITEYLNALFLMTISVGAILAVIKIAVGGFQYMTAGDMASSRESARKSIIGALIGLGILLVSFVALATIYPGLVQLEFLRTAEPVGLQGGSQGQTQSVNTIPLGYSPVRKSGVTNNPQLETEKEEQCTKEGGIPKNVTVGAFKYVYCYKDTGRSGGGSGGGGGGGGY